ncbi:hypothetical protein N7454_007562 [Penicillium verhagenii]|nr:hypothetical protein N7454_007562 [Penicillium verhagenii]
MFSTVPSHAPIDAAKVEKRELEVVDFEEHAPSSSTIDDPAIEEEFVWNYDVITNLIALNAVFFAASWGLVVPTSAIGFIARVFPENASDSPWIAATVTIPNCILQAFFG